MGRDILGSAQTGTGKTASFTLPLIDILDSGRAKARMPRSLILAPTRELAAQVAESFEKFSTHHALSMALLIGGVSFADQEAALDKGVDVLIATPGRLLDHFERGKVLLQDVKILVIDEADRMLDMGFIPDIERIVGYLPVMRQTLFFSATLSPEIQELGGKFVMNPKVIEIGKTAAAADTVTQGLVKTGVRQKRQVLRDMLRQQEIQNAVIFCNRKRDIATLLSSLKRHEFSAVALHGDMTQSARLEALDQFKTGEIPLLIASDVAARGLDIPLVSHVFNFDIPSNAEDYVHRIGRTGRAGREGTAISICATADDEKYLDAIEKLIGQKIPDHQLDSAQSAQTKPSRKKASQKQTSQKQTSQKQTGHNKAVKDDAQADSKPRNQAKTQTPNTPKPNTNKYGEKRPPAWIGTTFQDSDEVPAFLLRSS